MAGCVPTRGCGRRPATPNEADARGRCQMQWEGSSRASMRARGGRQKGGPSESVGCRLLLVWHSRAIAQGVKLTAGGDSLRQRKEGADGLVDRHDRVRLLSALKGARLAHLNARASSTRTTPPLSGRLYGARRFTVKAIHFVINHQDTEVPGSGSRGIQKQRELRLDTGIATASPLPRYPKRFRSAGHREGTPSGTTCVPRVLKTPDSPGRSRPRGPRCDLRERF